MKIKIGKSIVALLMVIAFSLTGYSHQPGDDIWKNLVQKETANYKFSVPAAWRQIKIAAPDNPEQYFEASGTFLPVLYNKAAVIVTAFIVKMDADDLEKAKEQTIAGYKENSDRVFTKRFVYEEMPVTLKSGEAAYLLNTRFYRKSARLYQSRYDLVAFSSKTGEAYLYTLSVQYKDSKYNFEKQNNLKQIARKLYENFQLKNNS